MKLSNLWKEKEVTLSFEAFPPKKDSDFASVAIAVEKIAQLKPDFMSVTYGAGGGTTPRATTPPPPGTTATPGTWWRTSGPTGALPSAGPATPRATWSVPARPRTCAT